eukprot:CAMPEP_0184379474 /NCGR_PEP_ID=MMETSP0007-20130409/3875_1 /TAXON_ID=97485 /ORGANISM="Prymnesium parvum, Strain Texoma1" /LENGTH=72 /DNA_ID=CAMNT_0026724167 /DNA_START=404 /DNA_END=622 /DNA_ORIENTATION=+
MTLLRPMVKNENHARTQHAQMAEDDERTERLTGGVLGSVLHGMQRHDPTALEDMLHHGPMHLLPLLQQVNLA